MLCAYLNSATSDLESLIKISLQDLEDIKIANHEAIFARLESKNNLIASFQNHKSLADAEVKKMLNRTPNAKIEDLLEGEAMKIIDKMRENLKTLKSLNRHYSRAVLAISEFYSSMVEQILPSQKVGYYNKNHSENLVSIEV